MGIYLALSNAFTYPNSNSLSVLQAAVRDLPACPEKKALERFLQHAVQLSLGEWEEIYTHTLDLNPMTAPYIGYQIWGDSYERGTLMAKLNRTYQELSIAPDGELPDHLTTVLRYLDQAEKPLPEVVENLAPAVEKMQAELRKKKADNPYLYLFEATLLSAKLLQSAS